MTLAGAPAVMGDEEATPTTDSESGVPTLRVGSAHADVTPDRPMPNYKGDLARPNEGSSRLQVHVVLCTDGETKAAIVSVDCTFLGRAEVQRIREALWQRIGVEADRVCVAATHTHAAPATTASFLYGELPDPQYLDTLIERTCQAAERAASRLEPARLKAATIPAPPIGICRRRVSPEGQVYMASVVPDPSYEAEHPIDEEMQYVVFESSSGKPLAAIFNFACHNNMVGGVFSGDMLGRAGEALRDRLGDDVATVALAAPCGDVGYRHPGGRRTYPNDRAAGQAIADAVIESYSAAERRDCAGLVVRSKVLRIPDRPYDPAEFVYDGGRGSGKAAVEFHRRRYTPEEAAVRRRGQTHCDVELQVIAFGSVALATDPAELFSVYSVKIKEASPFDVTLVSSLTNGYCGYVPTPKSFEHRGYETYRTVRTSRLAKDAGEQILRESVDLLQLAYEQYPR
jgi:hypothetical protein